MSRLIHISEASSIAIHTLALIANSADPLNAKDLGMMTNFSKNHISKVMQILVRGGYLTSGRGPKGGFLLKTSDKDITLLEIIELIEGTIEDKHCRMEYQKCPFTDCVFGGMPEKLTGEFKKYFATTKISDLKKKTTE